MQSNESTSSKVGQSDIAPLVAIREQLYAEFYGRTERSLILISAVALESALTTILKAFLLPEKTREENDRLFGCHGSVRYFASKINLACRLGLISDRLRKDLDSIKNMRNDCAHKKNCHLLDSRKVKNLSGLFVSHMPALRGSIELADTKGDFLFAVDLLLFWLDALKKDISTKIGVSGSARYDRKPREIEKIYNPDWLREAEEAYASSQTNRQRK